MPKIRYSAVEVLQVRRSNLQQFFSLQILARSSRFRKGYNSVLVSRPLYLNNGPAVGARSPVTPQQLGCDGQVHLELDTEDM